jgi:hypothetical protein
LACAAIAAAFWQRKVAKKQVEGRSARTASRSAAARDCVGGWVGGWGGWGAGGWVGLRTGHQALVLGFRIRTHSARFGV